MAPEADWNLRMVRSREARRLLPKVRRNAAVDWGDIRVAHLDTGYTRHPAFGFRPGETPGSCRATASTCSRSASRATPSTTRATPVTALAPAASYAARPCRSRARSRSAARSASRHGCRWCPAGSSRAWCWGRGSRRAVAEGIRHAVAKGCQVVCISLGIPSFARAKGGMGRAVDEAYEAGVIVVAAGGQIIDSLCYPRSSTAPSVSAGDAQGEDLVRLPRRTGLDVGRRPKTCCGSTAWRRRRDPAAGRGRRPRLANLSGQSDSGSSGPHSGKSRPGDGTSYATVHVAAAAAMWLRHRAADLERAYGQPWQRVEAFRLLLRQTGRPLAGEAPRNGTGILDIEALLKADLPPGGELKAVEDRNKTA